MNKCIISIVSALVGAGAGAVVAGNAMDVKVKEAKNMSDKHLALFLMMNQWVKVKQAGKDLASYFKDNGYKRVAIYGMSYIGETLVEELRGTDVEVVYGIDKNVDSVYSDVNIVSPDEKLETVDAVIVTPITYFQEIEGMLSAKMECPIVSLEDILFEL